MRLFFHLKIFTPTIVNLMKIGPQFWPAELFNIKVDEPVGSCQMSDSTILLSTIVKLTFLDTCASYFCQAFNLTNNLIRDIKKRNYKFTNTSIHRFKLLHKGQRAF